MINFRKRRVSLVIIICEGPRGKMGASDDVALHYPIFSKFALLAYMYRLAFVSEL